MPWIFTCRNEALQSEGYHTIQYITQPSGQALLHPVPGAVRVAKNISDGMQKSLLCASSGGNVTPALDRRCCP